jgi:transcriptional regulator with XRE-family HTH domain
MNAGTALRDARRRAGLSQADLAERAGTSQATISAYESGAKEPGISTLERLLGVTGHRLELQEGGAVREPTRREIARRGRVLAQVLSLAEALPARRRAELRYPNLSPLRLRGAESPEN